VGGNPERAGVYEHPYGHASVRATIKHWTKNADYLFY